MLPVDAIVIYSITLTAADTSEPPKNKPLVLLEPVAQLNFATYKSPKSVVLLAVVKVTYSITLKGDDR